MSPTGLSLAAAALLAAASPAADEHLLAGARLFRGGQYAEALVEFRVAQRLGAADAAAYTGVTLVKLGRPEEAVEAFGGGDGPGPYALVDYYRAAAAYDARLYQAADSLLAALGQRAGPKIGEQAARLRAQVAVALAAEPAAASIDWYLARCADQRKRGNGALAGAYCREAAGLAARRPDRHGSAEASRGLATSSVGVRP